MIEKDEIKKEISHLLNDKKAREAIEIIDYLGYDPEYDSFIIEVIQEMLNEYELYNTKHNRYMNFQDSELAKSYYKGYFETTKGEYGFVTVEGLAEDIFIPADMKNSAMDKDLVLVTITKGSINEKKCEGKIIKVLKRYSLDKVGEVFFQNGKLFIQLIGSKNRDVLKLDGDNLEQLVEGDRVTVSILDSSIDKYTHAKFLKRIGHKNDPGIDIISILAENSFDVEFPNDVIEELKDINTEVLEEDLEGRTDLRDEIIFTIDGDDTKDIDDALSIKKLSNGNYELGVHIADVSYYIHEDSPLDKEARNRGTSVYLADRVVPMIPHQLSNGICSLNPGVDRLAISCVMEVNTNGEQIDFNIFPSVIRSRIQMTYKKVNAYLKEQIIHEGYEEYTDALSMLAELSKLVRRNKINRGFIDFDTDEEKIIVDELGTVLDIVKRERGIGEKLIEDFMILANECVASYLYNMELPSVYRVHGNVNINRLKKFINVLSLLGIKIKDSLNVITPKTIQRIINNMKENDAFPVLSMQMLSCMDKAKYEPHNIGHFGIASRCYTHFTSPIRRYPDTTIHRLLREYFFSSDGITNEKINHFENILTDICKHASERERAAMECEREVNDMKMAEYMENHIGEVYNGMVSGVTSFGLFVLLDNLVEGMIRLDSFDDYYVYDDNTLSVVGRNSRRVITIGTKMKVKVIGASRDTRRIDFEEVKNEKEEKV